MGAIHQFETDVDDGGRFSVTRAFVEPTIAYGWDRRTSVALALGFGLDDYDFEGSSGLTGLAPWDKVAEYRLSLPIRFGVGERTSVFLVPSVRWNAETDADLGDAASGGAVAGFSYRFSDRFSIGPGIAVLSEIEGKTKVLPIPLIDWRITDTVSLATGGPGLTLGWQALDKLNLGFGGGYKSYRFRLGDEGVAPGGLGEEKAASLSATATYSFLPNFQAGFLAGVNFAGELKLEDSNGNKVVDENVDSAPFFGMTVRAQW